MILRNYKFRDVDMLMASSTVVTNLSNYLEELSLVRTNWTPEFVTQQQEKIDSTIEKYLGLDKKKVLRDATALVTFIQATAKREVSFLKTQIEVDFPEQKVEILKTIGFGSNFSKIQNDSQEALIELLYAFKKGLSNDLKDQIVAKGTNPALIDKIISYADQLKEADSNQEILKKSTIVTSEEAIIALNEIYNEAIGICKIASNFYKDDPVKKAMFTFSQIVAAMSASKKTSNEEVEVESEE